MMKATNITLLTMIFIAATVSFVNAQDKTIHTREQVWFGYFNQTRIE